MTSAVFTLAEQQMGVVSFEQLRTAGLTRRQIEQRVVSGLLERVHLGVFRLAGAPRTYRQRLIGACLAVGPEAAASHRAASVVLDLLRYREPPIELSTNRRRSPELSGVVVHRLADHAERWIEVSGGARTTNVARTLVDLGSVASPRTVEAALDRAVGRRLVTYRHVRDAMLAVARQGRRGVGTIRPLLEARIGAVIPAGVFEARMAALLRRTRLPAPLPELVVVDELGAFVAVVDFGWPDRRLAIEVDGYEFHSSPSAFADRNKRDRMLADVGWLAMHFGWNEVEHQALAVAAEIERMFWAR